MRFDSVPQISTSEITQQAGCRWSSAVQIPFSGYHEPTY